MLFSYGIILFAGYIISIVFIIILARILGYTPEVWTSILQGSIRQNAFIALAIAGSFLGVEGLKIASFFTFIYVPSINVIIIIIMVINLNSSSQKKSRKNYRTVFNEIFKNPFILAMIAGLFFSIFEINGLKYYF
jgi:predicted permease